MLMYHRFGESDPRRLSVRVLDEQLRYIRKYFSVIPLRQLILQLRSGETPRPYTIALTVDDGYADFAEQAYPIFRAHRVPVTVFVVSDFCAGRIWLWWDALRYALAGARAGHYSVEWKDWSHRFRLGDPASREEAWATMAATGLTLGPDERDQFVAQIAVALSVPLPPSPTRDFAAMDWRCLQSLDPNIVDVGAHTETHAILARCSDGRLAREVGGCKIAIEQHIGRRVSLFSYPNGGWEDVDARCLTAVRDTGFDGAVMGCGTVILKNANPFALDRLPVSPVGQDFVTQLSGMSYLAQRGTAYPPMRWA